MPEELATDGSPVYVAFSTQQFFEIWGVRHRLTSAYHPHSNLRAETAVKTVKTLIANNISPSGSLDTNAFLAAMLNYRNTPDRDTRMSPAQILFACTVPTHPDNLK